MNRQLTPAPTHSMIRTTHGAGFWLVGGAFLLVMAYSTVSTTLHPLYQQRDGSDLSMITVIFAASPDENFTVAAAIAGATNLGGRALGPLIAACSPSSPPAR